MIGGRGDAKDGRTLLLLGLSEANLQKLRQGRPLDLTHESHDFIPENLIVVIFSAETEEEMTRQLRAGGIDLHGPHGVGQA